MNQSNNELNALGRIIVLIKTYRHQTGDYRAPAQNDLISAYLKQRLSGRDWTLWHNLIGKEASVVRPVNECIE